MKNYLKSFATRETAGQFLRMGAIGVFNTGTYFMGFNIFRIIGLGVFTSVTLAFAIGTLVSYVLNRRWAFQITHGRGSLRETVQFFAINIVAWGVTAGIVVSADRIWDLSLLGENVANVVASLVILIPKFASYRDIVFGKALAHKKSQAAPPEAPDASRPAPDGSQLTADS